MVLDYIVSWSLLSFLLSKDIYKIKILNIFFKITVCQITVKYYFQGESASSKRSLTAYALIALKEVQDREVLVSMSNI